MNAAASIDWLAALAAAVLVASLLALLLLAKSVRDFTSTGPQLRDEVRRHYRGYVAYALARLTAWVWAVCLVLALWGVSLLAAGAQLLGASVPEWAWLLAAAGGIGVITVLRFCQVLATVPVVVSMSSHYSLRRLVALWERLSAPALRAVGGGLSGLTAVLWLLVAWRLGGLVPVVLALVAACGALLWWRRRSLPRAAHAPRGAARRPNFVLIGSDTLRADRLGGEGYRRTLTPQIDALAARGVRFSQCYVPCARTAPSLVSMLTGCWPHRHAVTDNFVGDDGVALPVPSAVRLLRDAGYATAAVGDWAASDLGKFDLGFECLQLPPDQWNLKYLLRQGPKDMRLFLSLFLRNRLGQRMLPEIYYLAGLPLTREVGRDARAMLDRLAADGRPFLLNVFMATTHPPFGSEAPYYTRFADPAYRGESRFAMARLTDPFQIIERQGEPRTEFDLEQIIDLYDGCVASFDDEVGRIVEHLRARGLGRDTVIIIYSDHGMEFFEHGTWGQGNSVRGDASSRVPLVLVDPARQQPVRVDAVVRSVDLAPTLLELAGVPLPPGMDGRSLLEVVDGGTAAKPREAYAETGIWLTRPPGQAAGHLRYPDLPELLQVADKATGTLSLRPEYRGIVDAARDRMLRNERWKITVEPLESGEQVRLFDLRADPGCEHDVAAQHPDIVASLRARLAAWVARPG